MIRLAHLSDSHFDERGRLSDVVAVHRAFLDQAREAEVDLIVHAGDWFERRSTPAERWAVARFLQEASGVAPVGGCKGNHDQAGDLDVMNLLETDHRVFIADRPSAAPDSAFVFHLSGGRRVGLLALPWFDRAHLVAGLDATVDAERSRLMTIASARDLLTCMRAEATRCKREGIVPILVGHILIGGSEVSSGQTLIGTTVELAPGDILDVGAAYNALGHVHLHQRWFDGLVAYSGSPNRCNFGEAREAKGWCLVTLTDEGAFVSNEFRELPARRMVLLEVDWTDRGTLALPEHDDLTGSLVRFRYRVHAQDLHHVDEEAVTRYLQGQGAEEIQLEAIVEAPARERSSEIRTAQTSEEKLRAYCASKGLTHDEGEWGRIVGRLGELEARL